MKRSILFCALAACGGGAAKAPVTPVAVAEEKPAAEPAGEHAGHEAAAMPSWKLDALPKGAVLLGDLGTHGRKVTTTSPEAQKFFDQGLQLTYGFNHDEAARSFARAAEIDPKCAMCLWGAAYVMGPNYNVPMLPDRAEAAWDAVTRAQSLPASPVEKALIGALGKRYKGPEWIDPMAQQPFNEAYAAAMRDVAKQFPDDVDVQVLFAESLMNLNPWKLWAADGKPASGTPEILATLEKALAKAPQHPGANHYYIHAIEASKTPGKGVPSADRLGALMPNAGHAVHMPAHIYQRVGRYADASEANRRAIVSDQRYLDKVTPPGYYPFYLAHNFGFLAFSASMLGRSAESLDDSRRSANQMPKDIVCGMPGMDFFLSEPLLVMVRFGKWQEILGEAKPDAKYSVLTALWHHAHGMALASTGKAADARADVEAMKAVAEKIPADQVSDVNSSRAIVAVAAKIVEARIAEAEEKPEAIALWQEAVALEGKLDYSEPADWFYPTRHFLGAALLDAKKYKEAEAVYRADLERNPGNGWGLYGLWKSLEAQKRTKDARAAQQQFQKAWEHADIKLERSAF